MNLEALRGFLEVCRQGSFTRAARTLYLTQPAVSQQVKALEDELGIQLIEKRGRTFHLTPAGEEVKTHAEGIFGCLDEMVEAVDDIKGLRRGTISVAASDTVVMYLFPKWLKRFRAAFPRITIYLTDRMSHKVEELVLNGECDLGLITLPPQSSDVVAEKFYEEPLCLILPSDDPLASRTRMDLKAIASKPRIALGRGSATRRLIEGVFAAKGLDWLHSMELSGFEMIKRYVAAGFGAAIVPRMALKQGEGYHIRKLPRTFPKQELGIIRRKNRYISKPLKALIDIVKEG
jgi:DNA-binding transcriptional LysR family regulator